VRLLLALSLLRVRFSSCPAVFPVEGLASSANKIMLKNLDTATYRFLMIDVSTEQMWSVPQYECGTKVLWSWFTAGKFVYCQLLLP
jgi:hypothetical protein